MLEDGKRSEVPLNLTIEQRTEQLRKEDEIHLDLLVKTKNEKLKVRRVVPVMCEQLVCVCVSVRLCVSVYPHARNSKPRYGGLCDLRPRAACTVS